MSMQYQGDLFSPPELMAQIRCCVLRLQFDNMQPSARELLELLEKELGWVVRWHLEGVLQEMVLDPALIRMEKDYIRSLLDGGELGKALRGEVTADKELKSSIDDLIKQSKIYRNSRVFSEMVNFMARFREYAPFNNMLVRIQNPSCSYYATASTWERRFKRHLIEDARPMLILAPMHPVLMVYDLDQTEGRPVPEHLLNFAHFEGRYNPEWLDRMIQNAAGARIRIAFKTLSSTNAGFATIARDTDGWKMRIVIHDKLDEPTQLGVLCHELAHILLGHLGTDYDLWWPCRSNLTRQAVEIEAETCAYIAMRRLGLEGISEAYISGYLGKGDLPKSVSIDQIAKVSGQIERMARGKMPSKRPKVRKR